MSTTILVIEDEPAIQELISVNLVICRTQSIAGLRRRTGADPHTRRTSRPDPAGLDAARRFGITLARKLRADERTRQVPVIMLTAKGAEHDKIEGLEAGADDYITKPFSPKELMARIKAVLRRRAPQLTDDLIQIGTLSSIRPRTALQATGFH